jgi:hypothetical protein
MKKRYFVAVAMAFVCSQLQAAGATDHGWKCMRTGMDDNKGPIVQANYVIRGGLIVDIDGKDKFSLLQNDANGLVAVKASPKPFDGFKGVYADVLLISEKSGQLTITRVDINEQMSMVTRDVVTHSGTCVFY